MGSLKAPEQKAVVSVHINLHITCGILLHDRSCVSHCGGHTYKKQNLIKNISAKVIFRFSTCLFHPVVIHYQWRQHLRSNSNHDQLVKLNEWMNEHESRSTRSVHVPHRKGLSAFMLAFFFIIIIIKWNLHSNPRESRPVAHTTGIWQVETNTVVSCPTAIFHFRWKTLRADMFISSEES